MLIDAFLERLNTDHTSLTYENTIAAIDAHYRFTPTAFQNGSYHNAAGHNSGACKVFAFAKLLQLSELETLACFGSYYFQDVLQNPNGNEHPNIRNFIKTGWEGISFEGTPLEKIN